MPGGFFSTVLGSKSFRDNSEKTYDVFLLAKMLRLKLEASDLNETNG